MHLNSKFIYVKGHICREMSKPYRDVLTHKCHDEEQVFKLL